MCNCKTNQFNFLIFGMNIIVQEKLSINALLVLLGFTVQRRGKNYKPLANFVVIKFCENVLILEIQKPSEVHTSTSLSPSLPRRIFKALSSTSDEDIFAKIVSSFEQLTVSAKKLHHMRLTGSSSISFSDCKVPQKVYTVRDIRKLKFCRTGLSFIVLFSLLSTVIFTMVRQTHNKYEISRCRKVAVVAVA